jgi:hypothetical protein
MPTCSTLHTSIQHGWEILAFASIPLLTYAISNWGFKMYKYIVYASFTRSMPVWLRRIIIALGCISIAYAAWRVWSCGGWDIDIVPLALWFFYVVFGGLESLIFSVSLSSLGFVLVWQVICLALSIGVTYFFITNDTLAGIVAICHIVFWLYEVFYSASVYLFPARREEFSKNFNDWLERIQTQKAASTEDVLRSEVQSRRDEMEAANAPTVPTAPASQLGTSTATTVEGEKLARINAQYYPNSNLHQRPVGTRLQIPPTTV